MECEVKLKEDVYLCEQSRSDDVACRKKRIQDFSDAIRLGGSMLVVPTLLVPDESVSSTKIEVVTCGFCGFGYKNLQYATIISPCMHSFHLACAVYAFNLSTHCCVCTQGVSKDWLQSIGITTLNSGNDAQQVLAIDQTLAPPNHSDALVVLTPKLSLSPKQRDASVKEGDLVSKTEKQKEDSYNSELSNPIEGIPKFMKPPQPPKQRNVLTVSSENDWMGKLSMQKKVLDSDDWSDVLNVAHEVVEELGSDKHESFGEDEHALQCNLSSGFEHEAEEHYEIPSMSPISPQEHCQQPMELLKTCGATPKDSNTAIYQSCGRPTMMESIGEKQGQAESKARRKLGSPSIDSRGGDGDATRANEKPCGLKSKDDLPGNAKSPNKMLEIGKKASPKTKNQSGGKATILGRSKQGGKEGQGNTTTRAMTSNTSTKVTCSPIKPIVSLRLEKKLLILDLNKVFVKRFEAGQRLPRRHPQSTVHQIGRFSVVVRPGHLQFVRECMKDFAVAIWSTLSEENLATMLENLFPEDVHSRFAFIWDQRKCEPTNLDHPHTAGRKIWLKDLQVIWSSMSYNSQNTLLVEDSEYKCLRNPRGSYIIPHSFSLQSEAGSNVYLIDDLLPYLEKVVAMNMAKSSS